MDLKPDCKTDLKERRGSGQSRIIRIRGNSLHALNQRIEGEMELKFHSQAIWNIQGNMIVNPRADGNLRWIPKIEHERMYYSPYRYFSIPLPYLVLILR